ncbi:acyl-CoA dehydrogenase family protein [Chloroflexota bacterium]
MEFGFSEEQERLRKEFREFCLNELPEDYVPGGSAFTEKEQSFWKELQKKAGKKGYLTPGWPKEYGGMGMGAVEQGIVAEETAYLGMMWPSSSGLRIGGPAVGIVGTEEQKKRFLPPLAQGEAIWNQAFTEPEAGSDEANVQLRAVADGDDFVLNGQKIFISHIYKPDYLYTLTRTADVVPKHRGMSLFLVPGDTPGLTFRPLPTMGFGTQNEVFFDDVRVPKENLLGQLNRGFYHAMQAFQFERAGTGRAAGVRRDFDNFVQFCKEEEQNGKPLIENPRIRQKLAQMATELEVFRISGWLAQWWFGQRERLGSRPYDLTGFYWKTYSDGHAKWMMDILGLYGQLRTGSKWAKLAGRIERKWQSARSHHGGGTIEIYKIVLAQRGLGMPRPTRAAAANDEKKQ